MFTKLPEMESLVQVLRFEHVDSKSCAVLDMKLLETIFNSESILGTKVAIISSCGPAQSGKSFIMNFIHQSFKNLQKNIKGEILDWENPDIPLQDFAWGYHKRTKGVWITTEPVTYMKNSKNETVAIFLMDTQGLLFNGTSDEENITILTVSLLLATTTFFSTKDELRHDEFVTISNVIENIIEIYFPDTPRSSMFFLIRDWIRHVEFHIGEEGGSRYISSFVPKSSIESGEKAKIFIQNSKCVLMPKPAAKVNEPEFLGTLNELTPTFVRVLESFLSSDLVNIEQAVHTGTELLSILSSFNYLPVGAFGNESSFEILNQQDIMKLTEVEQVAQILDNVCNGHIDDAEEEVPKIVNQEHENLQEVDSKCPTQLADELLEKYIEEFELSVLQMDTKFTFEEIEEIHIKLYASILSMYNPTAEYAFEAYMNGSKYLQDSIECVFSKFKDEVYENCQVKHILDEEYPLETNFDTSFESSDEFYVTAKEVYEANNINLSSSNNVSIVVDMATTIYTTRMESFSLGLPSELELQLQLLSEAAKEESMTYILQHMKKGEDTEEAITHFLSLAKVVNDKAFATNQKRMELKVKAVNIFMKSLSQDYENRMSSEQNYGENISDLHDQVSEEIVSNFMLQCQIRDRKFCDQYAKLLQESLDSTFKHKICRQQNIDEKDESVCIY